MRPQVPNGVSSLMLAFIGLSTCGAAVTVYYMRKTGQLDDVKVVSPDTLAGRGPHQGERGGVAKE